MRGGHREVAVALGTDGDAPAGTTCTLISEADSIAPADPPITTRSRRAMRLHSLGESLRYRRGKGNEL